MAVMVSDNGDGWDGTWAFTRLRERLAWRQLEDLLGSTEISE